MPESSTSSEPASNPFDLAAPVSQRVEIREVLLAESRTSRAPSVELRQEGISPSNRLTGVRVGRQVEPNRVFVMPTFAFDILKGEEDAQESLIHVEATFVLVYMIDSFESVSDENIQAFGATNGVFNAWPYWREFVQNAVTRMGFSPITIPVFRFT